MTVFHTDPNTVGPTMPTSASNGQLDGYSILFVELEKLENTVNHTITKAIGISIGNVVYVM